jgi:hypothetical protein
MMQMRAAPAAPTPAAPAAAAAANVDRAMASLQLPL